MTQSQQTTEQTVARDPRGTSQMLANAAALANHAATHAAIHDRVAQATRQAADCTNYAVAAIHVAYDSLHTALYQGGDSNTAIQTLEQACMAADSARSATGFAARAVMRNVPPDQQDTALEQLPDKGTEAGAAHHPPARVPINWDTLSPSEKEALASVYQETMALPAGSRKVYRGWFADGDWRVTVNDEPLEPIGYHCPEGFSWGYAGSAPAELALCLLRDYLQEWYVTKEFLMQPGPSWPCIPACWRWQHAFKDEFLATLGRRASWEITDVELGAWLGQKLSGQPHTGGAASPPSPEM